MKKFWNLMLAALVIIGATACTENYEGVDKVQEAGFSFYAEVVNDGTRAYIDNEDGDKTWNTVWENGDKLIVKVAEAEHGGGGSFQVEFECKDAAKGQFVSYDSNAAYLQGQNVTITTAGTHHSLEGKKAFYTNTTINGFDNTKPIQLEAHTSFFRYTFNGEGEVKLTLSADAFRAEDGTATKEVTVKGAKGENFIAFWPTGEEVTLSYSVNGETIRTTTKAFVAGKVYNLGFLSYPSEYGVVGSFQGWDVAVGKPVKMNYVDENWVVAENVELYKDDAIKIVKGNSWDVSFGLQSADVVAVDKEYSLIKDYSQDILVAKNGKFNIYFNVTDFKFKYECVEEYTDLKVTITINNEANWNPLYMTLKKGNTVIADKVNVTNEYQLSGDYIGSTLTYQFFTNDNQTDADSVNVTRAGVTIIVKEPAAVKTMVYLNPGPWNVDGAWFAAYFWYPADASWKKMVYNSAKKVYECEVPDNCEKVIFCRMASNKTDLAWSSKWNQTNDIVNLKNNIGQCCVITGWNGNDFKWQTL